MSYSRDVLSAAAEKMLQRKKNALQIQEQRRMEIFSSIPEIRQIQEELSTTGFSVVQYILNQPQKSAQLIEQLKGHNLQLQDRIASLLRENGYPPNYLEIPYHCPACEDSGYVGTVKCSCFQALLQEIALQKLNQSSALKLSEFSNFDLRFFPTVSIDNSGVIPRDKMKDILQRCQQYADSFTLNSPGILMTGPTGLGKTHLSLAIGKKVIEKGYGVLYSSAQNLLNTIEKEHFHRGESESSTLDLVLSCDLLILDDLGSEFQTQFTQSVIYNIINTRLNQQLPIIISTNFSLSEIQDHYTERILSRIFGSYEIFKFVGKDIRQLLRRTEKQKML